LSGQAGAAACPIISVVGKARSGKTSLLEKLVPELKKRGYRVAVLKHTNQDIETDTVNKDSWRFSQAGSDYSVLSSAGKLTIHRKAADGAAQQAVSRLLAEDCDLLLTEGWKSSPYPKIEVHRREQGNDLLSPPQQLLAVVTDQPLEVTAPCFSREEVSKIADIIEGRLREAPGAGGVSLSINHTPVAVSPPLQDVLARTLLAMTSSYYQDSGEVNNINVSLRREN